uniref:Neprosin PEP catalytic domain-containing protein n=1 Tax=Brassica campestris TaxID=3711 RepID=M4CKT5_BRACM
MGMAGYTVALMMIGVIISPCLYGKEFSDHQEIKVQRLLKRLNKQALISIMMRPSFIPESTSTYTKKKINATQAWTKNGRCPKDTVPIRRIKKEDILRSKSIESFGKKTMTPGILLYGSSSVLEDDPSIGHEVYPGKYGDNNVRLFVYWTADGYQRTGCYNTDCPGFVQRSSIVTVGGAYTTVSEYNGNQYELSMLIWKDSGNWWLRIGEELVGYWPGELFNSIGSGATRVLWGGEIVNVETGGQHTATDMGSGHFADEGFGKASFFRSLMTVDGFNTLREAQGLYPQITNSNCYNVKAGDAGTTWGVYFFYGGPGLNARCP